MHGITQINRKINVLFKNYIYIKIYTYTFEIFVVAI